ncbi:hypothetical protein E3P86_01983 [Wallemia ichthyophaga]|uniref:Uncharacterized protein n=1 Tax=Wallemia ichthyophaga TaxID=245174 RepID=A0A4T0J8N1_WALIC|nr:hypothetical protein E3P86_01983 [Wallemia ichthyophaga]
MYNTPPLSPPLSPSKHIKQPQSTQSSRTNSQKKLKMKRILIALLLTLVLVIVWKISLQLLRRPTLEIVYAYYDEDIDKFSGFANLIRQRLHWRFKLSDTVYVKQEPSDELSKKLGKIVDNVVYLPNVGREGGTYLHHIIQRYKATIFPDNLNTSQDLVLADKTLFLQPHPAWYWIMYDRLNFILPSSAFLSLGPYVRGNCGVTEGHTLPQMKSIYQLFTGTECPDDQDQLVTWAGQFLVSQDRILNNPLGRYVEMLNLIEAPSGDAIHDETPWWFANKNDPSNPFIGHSLERSWPVIFDCNQPSFINEHACGGQHKAGSKHCQCFD